MNLRHDEPRNSGDGISATCDAFAADVIRACLGTLPSDRHEQLSAHLSGCEACQEVYANYPVIEALIGELFVYLSDDARAALLEVRPTVAPDEIPAAPEVPITTAFAQLWHAWQVAQGQNRLVPGVAVRRFRPAVWAHTKLLVPSRLVLCKLVQFLGSCGQTGQAILWMAGRMCRQMIASWCRSVRDLGPVLI